MTLYLAKPYPVRLSLTPGLAAGARALFDAHLLDIDGEDPAAGVVDLGFGDEPLDGTGLTAGAFLRLFLADQPLATADALAFGRLLLARLLADANLARLWQDVRARHQAAGRPLRLQVLLPPGESRRVAEVPLELLADERGFLFRRGGNRLVRSVLRMRHADATIAPGDHAGLAWANPAVGDPPRRLGAAVFAEHERHFARLARALGLEVAPPCREATQDRLAAYLDGRRRVALLSLIAHGDGLGGSLYLHCAGHPDFPADPGEPLREIEDRYGQWIALDDLAQAFGSLEDPRGFLAAFFLSWRLARDLGDPSAAARGEALKKMVPGFDPDQAPSPEQVAAFEEALAGAVAAQERALAERGEDPYGPLS